MYKITFQRLMKQATFVAFCLVLGLALSACSRDEEDAPTASEHSYFYFKTPEWERNVDCNPFNMPAFRLDSVTSYTLVSSNTSPSVIPASFYFSYPRDSSQIVNPVNLKKYSIQDMGQHTGPFQLSLNVQFNENNTNKWLKSKPSSSPDYYNEILAITYDGHNGTEAFFKVKGRYQMQTVGLFDTTLQRTVVGMYQLRVRTTRK